jgi:hypothetical protein
MRVLGFAQWAAALAAMFSFAAPSHAALIVENTSGLHKAKAEFSISGGGPNRHLTITLSNTSANDVLAPPDVLMALFFKTNTSAVFTPLSASVANQSNIVFESPSFGGNNLGGEWTYREGITGLFNSNVDRGVSGAGFGVFGPSNLIGGPDRNGSQAPDGLDYGILSAGDNLATGNTPVTGSVPYVKSAIVFTFAIPSTFTESNILASSVVFQYGTSLSEPSHGPGVPEPAAIGALAIAGVGLLRRR